MTFNIPQLQSLLEERALGGLASPVGPGKEGISSLMAGLNLYLEAPRPLLISPLSEPLACAKQFTGSFHSSCTMTLKKVGAIIIPILQRKMLRFRGANSLQGSECAGS